MLSFVRIVFAFIVIAAIGYQLAKWSDGLRLETAKPADKRSKTEQARPAARSTSENEVTIAFRTATASLALAYIESDDAASETTLARKLIALDASQLEAFYHDSLAFDFESSRAFEAAAIALRKIASQDPEKALVLLYGLSPANKERLASALATGWTQLDPLSAWDWIDSAWIDSDGEFIDRELQNTMFRDALNLVLDEREDYQLAAHLLASVVEPDLRLELADLIAFHVVSKNPAQALDRMDFKDDAFLDSAIMDAVISEWARRDSIGAMEWTLSNEDQVTSQGAKEIAKDLLLNGVSQKLVAFHSELNSVYKRDAVASESSRLLARRNPIDSIAWLASVESLNSRYDAYFDSLYELGHDDFGSSIEYAELANSVAELDRETVFLEALQSWTLVDPGQVRNYLDSSAEFLESGRFSRLRNGLN